MKIFIKYFIILLVVGVLSYLGYSIITTLELKSQATENVKKIPEFCIYNLDKMKVCSKDISRESSCLITYFDPDCVTCQYEAEQIFKNIETLKNFQIIMISGQPIDQIKKFSEKYSLNKFDNITFLFDKDDKFNQTACITIIPSSYIYNKHGDLVKQFNGEVKIDALLKYLNL